MFPGIHDTSLRTVGAGQLEATSPNGNALWYNSGYYNEPEGPHSTIRDSNGCDWYVMDPSARLPSFEAGDDAAEYNIAQFSTFMPGYDGTVSSVDVSQEENGHFEVRHEDGSGTMFYDSAQYRVPNGDYNTYEDANGNAWYAIRGEAGIEHRPVYENGKPVYDEGRIKTTTVDVVRYRNTPSRFASPKPRNGEAPPAPKRK